MPKPPGAKTKASGRSDIRDLYVFKGPAPATMSPESGHVRRKRHVRFASNRDRESEFPHKVMSALPPKADMCGAASDVRYWPKADIWA